MCDYVIVGAGSAGCVLANRLSEDPSVRVLVLEAGGKDRSPNIKIPAAFAKQFHTGLDWDFATEPEPHVDDRSLYIPRGKSLGGSSSMNAMLYARGRPLDYELWEQQGAHGWGWNDVLPYFLKSEDNARGASELHGTGGPLRVSEQRSPRASVDRRLLQASEAAGIPLVDGMVLAREIAAQSPLRDVIVRELKPGPDVAGRADLEADLRRRLMLIYHPVGTCRMSDGADAVVDSQLRVHGVDGLRVVDASVMPVITLGNTNAPTIMIAERAADLIRERVPGPEVHAVPA